MIAWMKCFVSGFWVVFLGVFLVMSNVWAACEVTTCRTSIDCFAGQICNKNSGKRENPALKKLDRIAYPCPGRCE